MRICPNQHTVDETSDYCTECGSRVDSTPTTPAPPPLPQLWTCPNPDCHATQQHSRFCEACGYRNRGHPDNADVHTDEFTPPPPPPPRTWILVAEADSEYFDRVCGEQGPDIGSLAFPTAYPRRTFALEGEQVFIGRRSRSRGVDPDIDLSAAPEDTGISHSHAAVVSIGDGQWAVVDIGSSNGTYLNLDESPLAVHTPTPIRAGDTIHIGAWTRLTLRTGPA